MNTDFQDARFLSLDDEHSMRRPSSRATCGALLMMAVLAVLAGVLGYLVWSA